MQTRHFDRISPLTVTLFRPALEPGLLCTLAGFSSAFLAVWCLQSDGQSGLVQHIDHAALGEGFFQAAKVGVFLAERCQPLLQSGIVGLDVGGVLALVEQTGYNLSSRNLIWDTGRVGLVVSHNGVNDGDHLPAGVAHGRHVGLPFIPFFLKIKLQRRIVEYRR